MRRVKRLGWVVVSSRLITVIAVAVASGLVLHKQQSIQPAYANTGTDETNFTTIALAAQRKAEATTKKPVNCLQAACLALSFDDGPDPRTTPQLLQALEEEQVHATFFVIGNKVAGHETLLRHIYNDGNEIGNHSWSHADFTKLKPEQMIEQINATQNVVVAAGLPPPRLFRPPYGNRNQATRDTIQLPIILWNIDPRDWHETDPAKVVSAIESQARGGGIMILHDSHAPTAAAARQFIHDLKNKYQLVTVSELLQLSPDAHGEFFGHPLASE